MVNRLQKDAAGGWNTMIQLLKIICVMTKATL